MITVRKSSCGKVMFSEAFVSHLFSRGWVSLIPGPFQGVDMASPWSLLGSGYVCGGYVWGWVCLGVVGLSREVGMSGRWIPTASPPQMGPEGGIPLGRGTWDTTGFSRQAGGTYPSGMLFFL